MIRFGFLKNICITVYLKDNFVKNYITLLYRTTNIIKPEFLPNSQY